MSCQMAWQGNGSRALLPAGRVRDPCCVCCAPRVFRVASARTKMSGLWPRTERGESAGRRLARILQRMVSAEKVNGATGNGKKERAAGLFLTGACCAGQGALQPWGASTKFCRGSLERIRNLQVHDVP